MGPSKLQVEKVTVLGLKLGLLALCAGTQAGLCGSSTLMRWSFLISLPFAFLSSPMTVEGGGWESHRGLPLLLLPPISGDFFVFPDSWTLWAWAALLSELQFSGLQWLDGMNDFSPLDLSLPSFHTSCPLPSYHSGLRLI